MLNTKIKPNRKKRFLCLFFVFLLLAALSVPCFAWTQDYVPYNVNNMLMGPTGFIDNGSDMYADYNIYYIEWSLGDSFDTLNNKAYDFTKPLPSSSDLDDSWCITSVSPSGDFNTYYYPSSEFMSVFTRMTGYYFSIYDGIYSEGVYDERLQMYNYFSNAVTENEGVVYGNSSSPYDSIDETLSTNFYDFELRGATYGYENGFVSGVEEGYDEGYGVGLSEGYSDGVAEGDVLQKYLLTIFSAPTYILSTIFNFELFGINIYLLITFLFTIAVIGIVLKKIL